MKTNLIKNNADFFLGIAIIIFAVTGYVFACDIKLAEAAMMPKFILIFIAIMGFGISASSVVSRTKGLEDATKVDMSEILGGILLPGAFLIGAYLLISFLGFYIAELVLIISLMMLQAQVSDGKIDFSAKNVIRTLIFAVISMLVMYGIFHYLFSLPTPKGIFGF